jgi:3-hydroxyisobutyrate dehydrogenase-like beta-hydroxyacid dehydrogenase
VSLNSKALKINLRNKIIMEKKTVIGFIGVGVMGEPMCRHLTTFGGAKVLVCDTHREPIERLESFGAQASDIKEIADSAEFIFLSLPSGEVVRSVISGDNGLIHLLRKGQTVIDLSTSSVKITLEVAQLLAEKGIDFADAPVMRTRAAAEAGTLAVPIGASESVYKRIHPLINTFASDISHVGNVSAGQVVKILNNMVLYETVLALSEACAIGRRAGVDANVLLQALSSGSADSFALRNHGLKAIAPQEFPLQAFPVSYARKDISYAIALADDVGVDACGARNLLATFDRAVAAGHGEKYAPAISLLFEGK